MAMEDRAGHRRRTGLDPEKRDQMLTATLVLQPEPNQEALPEPLDRELLRRYPEISEWVFLNLARTQGVDLIVALRTLVGA